jgi:hypothetical protein
MKRIVFVLLCLFPLGTHATDDRFLDAIKRSDPEYLHQLLMPGFYIRADDKKKYFALAQDMTNKTFSELHKFSYFDSIRSLNALGKLGTSAFSLIGLIAFYRTNWTIFRYDDANQPVGLETTKERSVIYGFLGALTTYFGFKAITDFTSIFSKQERFERHRNALAVEAVIQRLPVVHIDALNT